MCVQLCIPRWHIYHRELVLGGDDKHLPLVHPIERQHVISSITGDSPTGLLLLAPEALWKTLPIGLYRTCYGNADLAKFNHKKGTVEPVDVQVVTLVVHPVCNGHHNTACVWELRSVDQLRFLAVVDTDLIHVPRLAIGQCKSLYTPGIWLPFEVLQKADSSTEAGGRLIQGNLLAGGICEFDGRAELVQQWLDLGSLGGTVEITDMKGSKDLEKTITGEDRPEEG